MAKHWISTYNGTKIVKGYKKKFAVDTLTAIRDLQELGVQFKPEYLSVVETGEKHRLLQLQQKKQERLMEQHGMEEQYDEMGIWDDIYGGEYINDINNMDNHRVNFEKMYQCT